ncbi:hypothetical protein P4B35_00140 [Pontiellaceae bacterium B12227]|nr:hypothetical protein [Pontiellaceae bacterium B12227]
MRLLLPALILLSSTVFAEPFGSMVAITRQDPSMDWWYAVPQEFAPKINRISHVAKGEYFRILPVFNNYGTDADGRAHIIFDIEIIRPDGSPDLSLAKCEGHDGPAKSPALLPASAVVNMRFDPADVFGEYRINLTAVDLVNHQTNCQSEVLLLKKFSFQTLEESEREKLFFEYATAPDPSRAASAFMQTEHSFFDDESEPIWSAVWFFKTIFEENEYLIPHVLNEYPSASRKQKRDIILMMALLDKLDRLPRMSGDLKSFQRLMEAGRVPDPYAEITTGKQLDMLWAEFFATGRIKPVRQIVSSLNLVEHAGTLDRIKAGDLDPDQPAVYRKGMLEAVFQSALWSLRTNCSQCPLVFQYCIGILHSEELEKPIHSCLSMLLQSIDLKPELHAKTEEEK